MATPVSISFSSIDWPATLGHGASAAHRKSGPAAYWLRSNCVLTRFSGTWCLYHTCSMPPDGWCGEQHPTGFCGCRLPRCWGSNSVARMKLKCRECAAGAGALLAAHPALPPPSAVTPSQGCRRRTTSSSSSRHDSCRNGDDTESSCGSSRQVLLAAPTDASGAPPPPGALPPPHWQQVQLVRHFIHDSLYHPTLGYFSKHSSTSGECGVSGPPICPANLLIPTVRTTHLRPHPLPLPPAARQAPRWWAAPPPRWTSPACRGTRPTCRRYSHSTPRCKPPGSPPSRSSSRTMAARWRSASCTTGTATVRSSSSTLQGRRERELLQTRRPSLSSLPSMRSAAALAPWRGAFWCAGAGPVAAFLSETRGAMPSSCLHVFSWIFSTPRPPPPPPLHHAAGLAT